MRLVKWVLVLYRRSFLVVASKCVRTGSKAKAERVEQPFRPAVKLLTECRLEPLRYDSNSSLDPK